MLRNTWAEAFVHARPWSRQPSNSQPRMRLVQNVDLTGAAAEVLRELAMVRDIIVDGAEPTGAAHARRVGAFQQTTRDNSQRRSGAMAISQTPPRPLPVRIFSALCGNSR
jgi:hypothetical protein